MQDKITLFQEVSTYGWRLLYVQNILIIIAILFFPPQFFFLFFSWQLAYILGGIINLTFTFAIIIDLIAILLICISYGAISYYSEEKQSQWRLITMILGLCWVGLSFIWRINLFIYGPYDIGFSMRSLIATPFFGTIIFENPILFFILLVASLLFLAFFYSNDMLLFSKQPELRIKGSNINIGTFYGFCNLFGASLLIFYFNYSSKVDSFNVPLSPLWVIQLAIFIKLIITPILGIRTCRKSMSSQIHEQEVTPVAFSILHEPFSWLRNIWHISGKSRLLPSKSTSLMFSGLLLVLLLFPLSPFSIHHLIPQPTIKGPFIYRNYSNNEALAALEYLESASIAGITGCPPIYSMENETMSFFLDRITKGISIEGSSFHPYAYTFIWNVSLKETDFPTLNYSTVDINWLDSVVNCFTWWENSTYHHISTLWGDELNETTFYKYSAMVKWVYYGWFKYSEVFGEVGAHYIDVKQLMYLSANFQILSIANLWGHAVA